MNVMTDNPALHSGRVELTATAGVLLMLLVARIAAIALDPGQLYADETQYWIWSRDLDWGYFSKPPMIAWIIALTTSLFGQADWAVRLAAPFLHTATAVFLGLTAARLFGARTGMWTSIAWITLPSVWLSATVITTDGVLMTSWSAGLYCLVRLRQGGGWPSALGLGLAAGLGFLSKYAMIYFFLGTALALVVDQPARQALLTLKGAAALALATVLILPNLAWNSAHDFATVTHTAANANWGSNLFNFEELGQFLVDQLAVFGPVFFPVLLVAIVQAVRGARQSGPARPRLMLALYSLPILVIVCLQAFISRAHANWAASAYAAGLVLTVAFLLSGPAWRRYALYGSVGLHALVGISMMVLAASVPLSEAAGVANAFKRVRGWDQSTAELSAAFERSGADALVFDNRNDFHQMQRYGSVDGEALYMWLRHEGALNHAEQGWPLPDGYGAPVLIASERPEEIPVIERDFARFEAFGEITVELGGDRRRHYDLFLAQDYRRVARSPEYEAQIERERASSSD